MLSLLSRNPPPKSLGFDGGRLPPSWWFPSPTSMVVISPISFMMGSISFTQPCSHASTKSKSPPPQTTTKPPLFLLTRPPPEPPPPRSSKVVKFVVNISNSTMMVVPLSTRSAPTLLTLTTARPPPKPPWNRCRLKSTTLSDLSFSVLVFSVICCWCCLLGFKYAFQVFDKKSSKNFESWNNIISSHQLDFEHSIKVDNLETKFSRNGQTQVKEIILNWIWKKTMDSQSYIVTIDVLEKVDGRMLWDCFWIVCVFLAYYPTMFIVLYFYVIVTLREDSRQWIGHVLFHMWLDHCNFNWFII